MKQFRSINEILSIDECDQLCLAYGSYLTEKKSTGSSLKEVEEVVLLLLHMLPAIEMEGFADLFHQLYSLRECAIVEASLRTLDLHRLADLFSEAKSIYTRGQAGLTDDEYDTLNPFTLGNEQGRRFDKIGELVLAKDSEIYLVSERLCQYIRMHATQLGYNREEGPATE